MGKSVHSTPAGILSCETTGSSTLSALGSSGGGPIPSVLYPSLTCFTTLPKEGNEPLRKQHHVCFRCFGPSLLPSPDTALLLYIARCTLHSCAAPHSLQSLVVAPEAITLLRARVECSRLRTADCGLGFACYRVLTRAAL